MGGETVRDHGVAVGWRDTPYRRMTLVGQLMHLLPDNIISLEIGVAAGDFSYFLMEYLNIKEHHMVDPWSTEGDETRSQWFKTDKNSPGTDAQESYEFVVERFKNYPVKVIREFSHSFLINALHKKKVYDFIYVDGDHHAEAVYLDLVLSWENLKDGGVLSGDDYNWESNVTGTQEVKKAVQKFESTYTVNANVVTGDGGGLDQYWIRK